jgi:hypothetical protein
LANLIIENQRRLSATTFAQIDRRVPAAAVVFCDRWGQIMNVELRPAESVWPIVNGPPRKKDSPCEWSAAHVGRVMLAAMATDDEMQDVRGPAGYGSAHPAIVSSREAIFDIEQERATLAPAGSTRFRPAQSAIALAVRILEWLLIVLDDGLRKALQTWLGGSESSKAKFCEAHRVIHDEFISMKDRALALIAFELNRRREPVFNPT